MPTSFIGTFKGMTILHWHAQWDDHHSLGLVQGNVLDPNLPTPFRCIKVLQGPTIFLSNINIDISDIYLIECYKGKITLQTLIFTKGQDSWAINTP